jgi:hypothetical protein
MVHLAASPAFHTNMTAVFDKKWPDLKGEAVAMVHWLNAEYQAPNAC